MGYSSGDDPLVVRNNREIAAKTLGVNFEALVFCHQVHSAKCLGVTEQWSWNGANNPSADAMVTKAKGIVIGVFVADCAPILFADPVSEVVGVAHAGWKGAMTGVCEATIENMEANGALRERMLMVVGPCINQRSYEVGDGFEKTFLQQDACNEQFFVRNAQTNKLHFDLPGYIKHLGTKAGIRDVSIIDEDTYSDKDRFFSARRALHMGESGYGRMMAAIGII